MAFRPVPLVPVGFGVLWSVQPEPLDASTTATPGWLLVLDPTAVQ